MKYWLKNLSLKRNTSSNIRKKKLSNKLKPKRKFYDYEAKYNPRKTEHIILQKLAKTMKKLIQLHLKHTIF